MNQPTPRKRGSKAVAKAPDDRRGATERGYGARWQKYRVWFLRLPRDTPTRVLLNWHIKSLQPHAPRGSWQDLMTFRVF